MLDRFSLIRMGFQYIVWDNKKDSRTAYHTESFSDDKKTMVEYVDLLNKKYPKLFKRVKEV